MEKIFPISGRGKKIIYSFVDGARDIKWGNTKFQLHGSEINDILEHFFIENSKWYPLGADEVNPMPNGLGSYLKTKHKGFTPRHASVVAAIMYHEGLIDHKDQKPILLRKS